MRSPSVRIQPRRDIQQYLINDVGVVEEDFLSEERAQVALKCFRHAVPELEILSAAAVASSRRRVWRLDSAVVRLESRMAKWSSFCRCGVRQSEVLLRLLETTGRSKNRLSRPINCCLSPLARSLLFLFIHPTVTLTHAYIALLGLSWQCIPVVSLGILLLPSELLAPFRPARLVGEFRTCSITASCGCKNLQLQPAQLGVLLTSSYNLVPGWTFPPDQATSRLASTWRA